MNILYFTPDLYYTAKFAGGMGTKTRTIEHAWGQDHHIDIASFIDEEAIPLYDVILIELLGLRNDGKLQERVEDFSRIDIPKVIYGSDSELLRWSGSELKSLKEVITVWIPNMQWQGQYFMDFGLPVTDVVYEPIDCDLFRPAGTRKKTIIAGGAVSLEKQSDFFIELFGKLQAYDDYETVYLGSAGLWGERTGINYELESELKAVTDVFHGAVPQSKVATVLGEGAIGVHNPLYETCNRLDMEMMASGVARVCGPHLCYDERPTVKRFTDVETCIEALAEITTDFTTLPLQTAADEARQYAEEHFSFDATLTQLNDILRSLV